MATLRLSSIVFSFLVINFLTSCGQLESEVSPAVHETGSAMGFGGAARGKVMSMDASPAESSRNMMAQAPGGDSSASSGASEALTQEKKIIKNGSITLTVTSLKSQTEAKEFIKSKAKEFSVSFDREDENRWGNQSSLSMTARVPAEKFEGFLDSLSNGPYTLSNRSVYINEVTERYIDLEVRLKNKKELRDKYTSLLKRADKVKDVLEINKSIETVTSDIESLEGQFKYLKHQIALSVLHITVTAELPETMKIQNGFFQDIGLAIYTGVSRIRGFAIFLISMWPLLILIGVGVFAVRAWIRKRKKSKV